MKSKKRGTPFGVPRCSSISPRMTARLLVLLLIPFAALAFGHGRFDRSRDAIRAGDAYLLAGMQRVQVPWLTINRDFGVRVGVNDRRLGVVGGSRGALLLAFAGFAAFAGADFNVSFFDGQDNAVDVAAGPLPSFFFLFAFAASATPTSASTRIGTIHLTDLIIVVSSKVERMRRDSVRRCIQ
jgi:hypothetical protein